MTETITGNTLAIADIKAKIIQLNQQAQQADAAMRAALQAGDQAAATRWRTQRDACNAEVKTLTALLQGNPPVSEPPLTINESFIVATANAFNSSGNQDEAHNAILKELLNTQYRDANIPLGDSKKLAYDAVRDNPGQPLHWLRNALQTQTLYAKLPLAGLQEAKMFPLLSLLGKKAGQTFFIRDFIQLYTRSDVTIENLVIVDDTQNSTFARDFNLIVERINRYQQQQKRTRLVFPFKQLAHRDAIQLIPERTAEGIDRYGGAIMSNVRIAGNVIFSAGALQGIFASDGAFKNLHIRNNSLSIGGEHTIAINGMLSGVIAGNTDVDNRPLNAEQISLQPLRLGGGANIYVLGFKNKPGLTADDANYYTYEPIVGLPEASDWRQRLDAAHSPRGSSFYRDVDMLELHALLKRTNPATAAQWQAVMAELVNKGFAQRV